MVKFECPYCGQSMQTAQFLNGKGHCLKCDAIVAETEKHPLNPEFQRKMREKFDKLNTDGKANKNGLGTLDLDEMSVLLKRGNPNLTEVECKAIFDGADTNGNGVIEFSEFLWFLYGNTAEGKKGPKKPTGEAGKLKPSDACETEGGVCKKRTDGGPCHFKFGACSLCHAPEKALLKGAGCSKGRDCPKGGKCTFKFAACTKCKGRE